MDNDIKDLLKDYSKNSMPDLWSDIEKKLDYKKKKKNRNLLIIAASLIIIFATGVTYKNLGDKSNTNISEDSSPQIEISNKIQVLEDLDLEEITKDKIVLGLFSENNYANDSKFTNYETEAEAIVYGKVINVNSYVIFGSMVYSDITIEVIDDYKNNISKGSNITLGVHGGELSYHEFIEQADSELVSKRNYNNIEDKNKKVIEIWDGVPAYRVGEYVLVYANSMANDEYFKNNPDENISYEYYPLKQLYVNPNTKEVFEYKYDYENNKLIKEYVKSLESLAN